MKKRIVIIFSILLFFTLVVVLSSILFKIDSVEIIYTTSPVLNIEEENVDANLLQYKGTSIFFLNEKNMANRLEADFANIKVVNIERVFPKKVLITVQERIEVYCFKIEEKYVYTDYTCKVLRISDTKQEVYGSQYGQVIDVKVNSKMVSSYRTGEVLEFYLYGATNFLTELYLNSAYNKNLQACDPIFFRKYIEYIDLVNFYVSDSLAEIKMETGALFEFAKALSYGETFIKYINRLMENDPSTGKQIDRIYGEYYIGYIGGECELQGQPIRNL